MWVWSLYMWVCPDHVVPIPCSLCMSPDPNLQWLAVAIQPGKISRPEGFKLVYCYDLKTKKLHHIFDAGKQTPEGVVNGCGSMLYVCVCVQVMVV